MTSNLMGRISRRDYPLGEQLGRDRAHAELFEDLHRMLANRRRTPGVSPYRWAAIRVSRDSTDVPELWVVGAPEESVRCQPVVCEELLVAARGCCRHAARKQPIQYLRHRHRLHRG